MTQNQNFLGAGWAFPPETDDEHGISVASAKTDVEQAIWLILGTAKGERVMRPEFGCGIHDYTFAAVDMAALTLIESSVEDALVEWEPRIEVRTVDVSTDDIDRGRLLVTVEYRIRQTNVEGNLVYPFYLNE